MAAFIMRNATVTIDTTAYQGQLKTVELSPDADTQTYKTLDPAVTYQDVDSASWTVKLTGPQDWTAATGLARYLTEHHGQIVHISSTPNVGGVTAEFDAIAMACSFGGEQGDYPELDVELPVLNQPAFTDPTTP